VHVSIRLGEDDKLCLLVVIGVREDGVKELLAVEDGYRESTESWAVVMRDLQDRGMNEPKLVCGDGALGAWAALRDVFPKARRQQCWVHKTANVLDALPKRLQPRAKSLLHEMAEAPCRADARAALERFRSEFDAKYPKATEKLDRDWKHLTAFYDFPAEHWRHLRTTNPIESSFATVKLRTRVTKGAGSKKAALAMAYKLLDAAQRAGAASTATSWSPTSSTTSSSRMASASPKTTPTTTQRRTRRSPPERFHAPSSTTFDSSSEAEEVHQKISDRERSLREHDVAAVILTDFRTAQNERAWPRLEEGAGALLSETTDGRYADVRLSADYKLVIVDRGEEHGLERYSGGEQDLANLCLRLAIADWVARERGVEIGFVVLDEVFGSQDEERRRRLVDELRTLSNRFHQLLVITHVPDIADLCEHQIHVGLADPGCSVDELAVG